MTADVYAAWLTAGNRLQPIGTWIGGHWTGLVSLAVAAGALWLVWWAIRDDCRPRDHRATAPRVTRFEERPEPAHPGTDQQLLEQCNTAYYGTANHRKEKP